MIKLKMLVCGFMAMMYFLQTPAYAQIDNSPVIIESFNASIQLIDRIQPVQLSWRVRGAVRVDIYDSFQMTTYPSLGNQNIMDVYPERTADYTLYAYGADGQVVSRTLTVNFKAVSVNFFIASTTSVLPGKSVKLSWDAIAAKRVDIYDSFTDLTYEDLGSRNYIEVYPMRRATYTLTALGFDGSISVCQLTLYLLDLSIPSGAAVPPSIAICSH